MLMRNRVKVKKIGALTARPDAFAIFPHPFLTASIIKSLDAALVWPVGGQSERK